MRPSSKSEKTQPFVSIPWRPVVAEDMTVLRAVEERLRRAQRMEAVGRLAAEVAVTCDKLLRNVSQDTQQWLATVGSNSTQRQQGELILNDVTRAAGFLRRLSAYRSEERRVGKEWRCGAAAEREAW